MSNQEKSTSIKLDVRAFPIPEPKGNVVGFASVTINDIFAVHGIRVMDSEKGKFAAMPSMKDAKTGEYRDVCHPVTGDLRKQLNAAVLEAYADAVAEKAQEKASVTDQIKEGAKAVQETGSAKSKSAKEKSIPER